MGLKCPYGRPISAQNITGRPTLSQNHFLPTHKLISHILPQIGDILGFQTDLIDWFEILVKIQLCAVI